MASPRISPREWVQPQSAFGTTGVGRWRDPFTAAEALDALQSAWLHRASLVVHDDLGQVCMSVVDLGRALELSDSRVRRGKRILDDGAFADIVKAWMLARVHRRPAERHDKPELDL